MSSETRSQVAKSTLRSLVTYDNCWWMESRTWKATPFLVGSSSPAGSPASRKRASQSATELKSSSLDPLFRLISSGWAERAPSGKHLPKSQNPLKPAVEEVFVKLNIHLRSMKVSRGSGRGWRGSGRGNECDTRAGHAHASSNRVRQSHPPNYSTNLPRPVDRLGCSQSLR